MNISDSLRIEREKRSLLLREVAAILKIDQALVSKIENGTREPTRKQLLQLAQLYQLDETAILAEWLSQKILCLLAKEDASAADAIRLAENKIIELEKQTDKAALKETGTLVDEMINEF